MLEMKIQRAYEKIRNKNGKTLKWIACEKVRKQRACEKTRNKKLETKIENAWACENVRNENTKSLWKDQK